MTTNPFLKFLYFVWAYKRVERSKGQLLIETDISYIENFVRGGVLLLLFGSSLLSLFLSGYSIYLFYYGISVFTLLILLFMIFKIIILPETYLSNLLGYTIDSTVDTSNVGRYRVRKVITKKSKGLFQSETHVSGMDSEKREFAYDVNPTGYVNNQNLPKRNSGYNFIGHLFRFTNFLIPTRPFFTLLINIGILIFSFFPIVNIFVILLQTRVIIQLFAVQWKGSGILNKLLILGSVLCLIANILIASSIYFILFVKL